MKYNFRLVNNHFIVTINNQDYILDTGSPASYFVAGRLDIDGRIYSSNSQAKRELQGKMGRTSSFIGTAVAGLIGNDVILETGISIDLDEGTAEFTCADTLGLHRNTLSWFMNYLLTDLTWNGRKGRFIVDSGAPLSYVEKKYLSGLVSTGTFTDYYAQANSYITSNTYDLVLSNGRTDLKFKAAEAKDLTLVTTLGIFGAEGVVGLSSFFEKRMVLTPDLVLYTDR